jgi:HK97 family phage prohead protease/HK97 family phage major capsid protein
MPISPGKNETQDAWMGRCVPEMMGQNGGTKRPQEQAVAACMTMWTDAHKSNDKQMDDVPDPDDDESHQDFMDRCMDEMTSDDPDLDEDDAAEQCQMSWENRAAHVSKLKRKTHAETVNGMEFVLSDETIDRMGDVILSSGWDLSSFQKNPIALFGHRSDFPIGKWRDLRIEDNALRGHLELAPAGTSDRIDEIRRLIDAGILKAVSVGFRSLESKPRKVDGKWVGDIFTRQELIETSLVSVPANPNALAIAKSLRISPDTLSIVFAEPGKRNVALRRRGLTGKYAETSRLKVKSMSLSQRIKDSEARINALRDQLMEHLKTVDDSNVSDAQLEITQEFNTKIAQEEKGRAALIEAEKHVAASSSEERQIIVRPSGNGGVSQRPFNLPAKKVDPIEYIVRDGLVRMFAHTLKRNPEEMRSVLSGRYPHYDDDATKAYMAEITRAASAPALTTVTGWAAELVETVYASFMETLMPKSVFPRLSGMGLSLSFGTAGRISIPTRARTPTIAGSFVGEGAPIPVRQGAFTAQILTPKKMAVITTFSREISEHSVPAIEGVLRQAIQEDTAVSLDSVLIDANPATAVRPPGLLNGVAALTATAGGGFNALVGDIKQLVGALISGTQGHIRSPAWLMNPQQVNSAGLIAAPGVGAFPFREEIAQGRLQGYPIIDSGTVSMGTVILVDAADFVTVGGEAPRFEVSDQATLHFEDTAPADIVGGASPGTAAWPVKSLWQTDSIGLRLILPLNWTLRRTGIIAWVQGVTW